VRFVSQRCQTIQRKHFRVTKTTQNLLFSMGPDSVSAFCFYFFTSVTSKIQFALVSRYVTKIKGKSINYNIFVPVLGVVCTKTTFMCKLVCVRVKICLDRERLDPLHPWDQRTAGTCPSNMSQRKSIYRLVKQP